MKTFVRILIITLSATAASFGQILVQYAFDGTDLTTALTPSTVGADVSASSIADVNGFSLFNSFTDGGLGSRILNVGRVGGSNNASNAVSNGSFMDFTLTPDVEMDLTSFTFRAARGGSSTPRGWVLRSSVDGFTSNLGTANVPAVHPTYTNFNVSLTDLSFQDLTSAVTFRLYTYSPSNTNTIRFEEITVNGTAIPEPSSLILLLMAMGAFFVIRKRRK